jgi:quercetin dioxygenase-like cupin family protein
MALHHARPCEKIHLSSTASREKTAALVKTERFEAAQLVLRAGDAINRHSVPGYATIQCLEGAVILEAGESIELKAGDWLYLGRGQEHSVSALENSSLLLTIVFE